MRRNVVLVYCLIIISFFASCSKDKDDDMIHSENDYFLYPIENVTTEFDVDESNTLFYTDYINSGRVDRFTDKNGKLVELPIMEAKLYCVNFNGKLINTYTLGETANNNLCISDEKAYYTTSVTINPNTPEQLDAVDDLDSIKGQASEMLTIINLYEFDMQDQSTKKIVQLTDINSISDFEVIDNKIYLLGIDSSRINKEYTQVDENDRYYYSGEIMKVIDPSAGTISDLPIDFPISYSKTLDNNLLIYAHDGVKGYYFTEYNCDKQKLSKKDYHDLGMLYKFKVFNKKNDILYNSITTSAPILSAAYMDSDGVTTELMPDVGTNWLVCQGDYAYYANNFNSGMIERIKIAAYIQGDKTIQMLSADTSTNTPFGCGFIIKRQYPSKENFALSVLSQDSDYDVCLMSSRQDISSNIRNKGSFYPLNDVEGVKEYLDACFPYIKEAATTEDGDVWMLPVMVNIPALIYNEDYCKASDIDLTVPMDLSVFLDKASALRMKSETKDSFFYSEYILTEDLLHQYLRSNTSFDNNSFKELAKLIKDKINYITYEADTSKMTNISQMLYSGNTERLLFDLAYYQKDQLSQCKKNNLRAASLPKITENQSNIATCIYLCVNPSSKNLKSTLQYINSLTYYLKGKEDLMLFSDRSIYSDQQGMEDLYHIYQNGDIQFTLPDELLVSDFDKYLNDEIDLSTLIEEADRKIETYSKE